MSKIFTSWTKKLIRDFKSGIFIAEHNLHEDPLFTDAALLSLLKKHPPELSMVYAMPRRQGEEKSFREGDFANRTPEEIWQAVEKGRLWVQLLQLNKVHAEFEDLEKRIIREMKQRIPGYFPTKCKFSLLISSPGINVSYHADIPRNALWHLRGEKRVYIYPATEKFLPDEELEDICLGVRQESIPYKHSFDDDAFVADLKPGQVATWPVNAPHRIENGDTLNVSMVMEYFEPHALLKYGVYYFNGILRRYFGRQPRSTGYRGPLAAMKLAAALLFKKINLLKTQSRPRYLTFAIDPFSPGGFVEIKRKPREH